MSKFKFICEDDNMPFSEGITTKRTFEFEAHRLNVIFSEFKDFLRGCGYEIDGNLEVVKESEDLDNFTENLFNTMQSEQPPHTFGGGGIDSIVIGEPNINFGTNTFKL